MAENVIILPLARRSGLVRQIADRLQRFERESAPDAADRWWRKLTENYRTRALSWGVSDREIDRQLRGLHHAVRAEIHQRRYEQRKREDRR